MIKLHYLPVAGALVAASLTVAACGTGNGASPAAAPKSTQPASGSPSAARTSAPAGPDGAAATAVPATSAGSASSAASAGDRSGFASALAAWKAAANAPSATMNDDFQRAADDLRASGGSGYGAAISELTYLASLPATNVPAAQESTAQADVKALDKFFGTPGLLAQ
jgi:hypothetical protein